MPLQISSHTKTPNQYAMAPGQQTHFVPARAPQDNTSVTPAFSRWARYLSISSRTMQSLFRTCSEKNLAQCQLRDWNKLAQLHIHCLLFGPAAILSFGSSFHTQSWHPPQRSATPTSPEHRTEMAILKPLVSESTYQKSLHGNQKISCNV